MVVNKQSFQKGKLAHSMISVFLLLILTGGIFITSNLFLEVWNSPKEYFIIISTTLLIIACVISREGINNLIESLKSRLFLNGVVVVCLLTTIHGILQYVGVIPSNHSAFPITGTFENPAGFAAVQAALFPFVLTRCFDKENGKPMLYFSVAVSTLCFVSVILSGSRTGVLAICSIFFVVLALTNTVTSFFRVHRWLWVPILIVASVSLVLLYYAKQDSADGRVFIWNRCFEMIKKRPLLGYGLYGFHGNYMSTQAEYFQTHPDSRFVMLADSVTHPFNEYIKLTVQYGLLGLSAAIVLLVLIVHGLYKSEKDSKIVGMSFVSSMFIFCNFSYPFRYAVIWLLSLFSIVPTLEIKEKGNTTSSNCIRIIAFLLLSTMFVVTLKRMYYDMKWTEISKRATVGQADRMLKYYDGMKMEMKWNPLFLYNYAVEMDNTGHHKESVDITLQCMTMWNDYDVQLLLGRNYTYLMDKENAVRSFDIALNMIPCRFEPLFGKLLVYNISNDTVNVVHTANEILEKPIKIRSDRHSFIVEVAKQLLSEYEQ